MKTIKKQTSSGIEYKRTDEKSADYAVKNQGWSFCPKTEWKTNVRDFGKEEAKRIAEEKAAVKAEEKANKKSKKTDNG